MCEMYINFVIFTSVGLQITLSVDGNKTFHGYFSRLMFSTFCGSISNITGYLLAYIVELGKEVCKR